MDGQTRPHVFLLERAQGTHESHNLQTGRMKAVRQLAHAAGKAGNAGSGLGLAAGFSKLQREYRQLLADVIVEFARDARALAFLSVQQPSTDVADAIIAAGEVLLTSLQLTLCLSALTRLDQQPGNERALRQEDCAGAEQIGAVALP